jgi:tetratricopeptide (TPR) repeat protein
VSAPAARDPRAPGLAGRRARAAVPRRPAARAAGALAVVLAGAAVLSPAFPAAAAGQVAPPLPRTPEAPPARFEVRRPTRVQDRRLPPLGPEQLANLRRGVAMRETGLLDSARVVLEALLAEAPHHPVVLVELARVHMARPDWGALERLAVHERLATRDSVLLARELALAYERTGRVPFAARTAIEAWIASPAEGDWVQGALARLTPAETRAARDLLRQACLRHPGRFDLGRALARLDWQAGDPRGALRTLQALDRAGARPPMRWSFADEMLRTGGARDSSAATDALIDLAADPAAATAYRTGSAQRAWEVARALGRERDEAPRVARALRDLPPEHWDTGFLVDVARALREGGRTAEARALLDPLAEGTGDSHVSLERALADLRDGPPERALPALRAAAAGSPEAAWHYAEAQFYAGQVDSARAWYESVSAHTSSPFAGAAFERLYLIEDAQPPSALGAFGRLAYEEWRGQTREAAAIADSLWRVLPRGALWAQAALRLGALRDALGDPRGALEPLAALADSLPGDRLAPTARQRLGDLYLLRIKDEAQALAQYEECLARYPKAWNAPEVRRRVEILRRERRF